MYVGFTPQDLKVTAAEYFFGTTDPGQGSGTTMLVMDSNYNEAIESVLKSNLNLDSGFNLLNIRVKDLNNTWGPLFKKTIYLNDSSALEVYALTPLNSSGVHLIQGWEMQQLYWFLMDNLMKP